MTTRYIIERIDGGYRAMCEELGVEASGPTVDGAVSSLRRALEERMSHVEAVAPPSSPAIVHADLEEEQHDRREADPSGPGDPSSSYQSRGAA